MAYPAPFTTALSGFNLLPMLRNFAGVLAALLVATLISGCTTAPRNIAPGTDVSTSYWQGRIAIKVLGDAPQSYSGDFELQGQPTQGQLSISTPLGTTLARMDWTANSARLLRGNREEFYPSLGELALRGTGVELPLAHMFDWLDGRPTATPGWEVDLSQYPDGRISAKRTEPSPPVELRIVLSR